MYAGPGSGSMRAAADAWLGISAQLYEAAEMYSSVMRNLVDMQWLGPSAMVMSACVVPYRDWLDITAAQAKEAGDRANFAAAAFEQAFAMTVPPALVAANRASLAALIGTNFFGQNNAAIAAAEAAYCEMWAQDASVMQEYSVTSDIASNLTPLRSPSSGKHIAHKSGQINAKSNGSLNIAASKGNWLGNLLEKVGAAIAPFVPEIGVPLYEAGQFINSLPFPKILKDDFTALDALFAWYSTMGSVNTVSSLGTGLIGAQKNLGILPNLGPPVTQSIPKVSPALLAPLNSIARAISGGALRTGAAFDGVSAAMGKSGSIGQISVPPSWAAPATVNAATTFQASPEAAPVASAGEPTAIAGLPSVPSSSAGRTSPVPPRYGLKMIVMSRPLSGG
ncbi:PPE family protein [Mycobacterium marinum]|uniref:PPE family protein n=1 Tax=Mycobacterium marinum TaxID=1781 RepID=UPI001FD2ABE5|nr:PPE family protein [Mycobacterium marinum]